MLLTGFPSVFVRSPDCTIWRPLLSTNDPLIDSTTSNEFPKSGVRGEQESTIYVGCPTDHSNFAHVNSARSLRRCLRKENASSPDGKGAPGIRSRQCWGAAT
jgi:hypothetical protein